MGDDEPSRVDGPQRLRGTVEHMPDDPNDLVQVTLESGERVTVPAGALIAQGDGSYRLALDPEHVRRLSEGADGATTLPLVQERLRASKRWTETGRVVVHIVPEVRNEVVDLELLREHADVERVPVNREVERPFGVRQEGDLTIVPVFEEVLVVRKKLLLKEEVRIRRRTATHRERREVPLRREEVRIRREGR